MLTSAEDNIVLSRPHSIPCTTSHKTCHKLTDISGNYYHANESAQQRNIDMLNTTGRYTNMDTNIIAVHTSIPYGASEEETQHIMRSARNESLTALLKLATDREDPVKAFVIERTRQSEENQKDRQTIQRLTRNNIIPPINYVQVSSTAERNLWAADAVAYSMAQAFYAATSPYKKNPASNSAIRRTNPRTHRPQSPHQQPHLQTRNPHRPQTTTHRTPTTRNHRNSRQRRNP